MRTEILSRWLKRIGIGLFLSFWLLVMVFPFLAFLMATRGQIQIGEGERSHFRTFMVSDFDMPGVDDVQGVGFELTRRVPQNEDCSRTSIRYLLWIGEADPIFFCQCYDPATGDPLPVDQSVCDP